MGDEISKSEFSDEDFAAFERRLRAETDLLESWFQDKKFYSGPHEGGSELEAWLIDKQGQPAPQNTEFIASLGDPLVVPELSRFNIEFNTSPEVLRADALDKMEAALTTAWTGASAHAEKQNLDLVMIGILPTVREQDLTIASMSGLERFKALNDQIFRMRDGKAIKLDIEGNERLSASHYDLMLEAAATSFQIHLKVNQDKAVRYYNASKLVSAPLLAIAANSPFLFGRDLWAETRIPLFEQAISVDEWDYAERVTFGIRFIDRCLSEVFVANRQRYEALLPALMDTPLEKMAHLKLHNGTIWRWNRALLGNEPDGTPHLRIEQRVVPSGPTIHDSMANAAFYYGVVEMMANSGDPLESEMPFRHARNNFYTCAKEGLEAKVIWRDHARVSVRDLILKELAPMAREGLARLEIAPDSIDRLISTIEARARTGNTGAAWQRAFVGTHGNNMAELTLAYLECQKSGEPVHEWAVP